MDKTTAIQQKADILAALSDTMIYLMGASFLMGSMTTLLALLLLDWKRRAQEERDKKNA